MDEPLDPSLIRRLDPWDDLGRRVCLRCRGELPEGFVAACGYKNPCPHCGYLYPLGDCSD